MLLKSFTLAEYISLSWSVSHSSPRSCLIRMTLLNSKFSTIINYIFLPFFLELSLTLLSFIVALMISISTSFFLWLRTFCLLIILLNIHINTSIITSILSCLYSTILAFFCSTLFEGIVIHEIKVSSKKYFSHTSLKYLLSQ